jgi:hypothetical protein
MHVFLLAAVTIVTLENAGKLILDWQGEGGKAKEKILRLFATPGVRIMIRH